MSQIWRREDSSLIILWIILLLFAATLGLVQDYIARSLSVSSSLRTLVNIEAVLGALLVTSYVVMILFRSLANESSDVFLGPLLYNWFLLFGLVCLGDFYRHHPSRAFGGAITVIAVAVVLTYATVDVRNYRDILWSLPGSAEDFTHPGFSTAQHVVYALAIADLSLILAIYFSYRSRLPRLACALIGFGAQTSYILALSLTAGARVAA